MHTSIYVQYLSIGVLFLLMCGVICENERSVGWNKANGLWGKRSSPEVLFSQQQKRPVENWSKLNTLWGKRSDNEFVNQYYNDWNKRAQWQKANGLWGRR